ncbi:uncharacterized protein METZ01_LOCUS419144, partial [marine metagenome]
KGTSEGCELEQNVTVSASVPS